MFFVRVRPGVSGSIVGGVARAPGQVVARVESLRRAVAILGTGLHMEVVDETGAIVWPPPPIAAPLAAAPPAPAAPPVSDPLPPPAMPAAASDSPPPAEDAWPPTIAETTPAPEPPPEADTTPPTTTRGRRRRW